MHGELMRALYHHGFPSEGERKLPLTILGDLEQTILPLMRSPMMSAMFQQEQRRASSLLET